MARKRMIDPEFWSDEEIGIWSHSARLLYIGLWNFSDDEGRFKAHGQLIKSQIFPYDKDLNIEELKVELGSKVRWYEKDGLQYGHICNFLKHQRIDHPQPSKLPPPPIRRTFTEHSQNVHRTIPPNIIQYNIIKDNINTQPYWAGFDKTTQDQMLLVSKRFNIYRLLGRILKQKKVQLPEEVINRICASYLKNPGKIKAEWPWFIVTTQKVWGAWNAEKNIREGQEFKTKAPMPQSIKDLVAMILNSKEST